MKNTEMRDEYNFSKSVKNPYISHLKKPITIRIEKETIIYFKDLAKDSGIPYQSLINLFLSQCAREKRKPKVLWK